MSDDIIERHHCNCCSNWTRHRLIKKHVQEGSEYVDGHGEIAWSNTYELLECCGCDEILIKKSYWFSEHPEDVETSYHPPRASRTLPEWTSDLQPELQALLKEVYVALQNGCNRIASMGARAVLDMYMVDLVQDCGPFAQKVQALEGDGHIGREQSRLILAALEVGSASAHRGHSPDPEHLNHAISIVETLLHTSLLKNDLDALEGSVPPRPPRVRRARQI